jgi:hypothetical protein
MSIPLEVSAVCTIFWVIFNEGQEVFIGLQS